MQRGVSNSTGWRGELYASAFGHGKEFRFSGDEVLIKRVGNAVVLLPKAKSWDTLVQSLDKFPADFMSDREQPRAAERRESLS